MQIIKTLQLRCSLACVFLQVMVTNKTKQSKCKIIRSLTIDLKTKT